MVFQVCTRDNTEYKWCNTPDVIGCLEVPSEPNLDLRGEHVPRAVAKHQESFQQAIKAWEAMNLREEFLQACDGTAVSTCCFGFLPNDDATIRSLVPDLNRGWMRATNRRLLREGHDFQLDCYLWNWENAVGKTETNILLIRFLRSNLSLSITAASCSSSMSSLMTSDETSLSTKSLDS